MKKHYPRAAYRVAIFVHDVTGDHALGPQADLGICDMVVLAEADGAASWMIEESGVTGG